MIIIIFLNSRGFNFFRYRYAYLKTLRPRFWFDNINNHNHPQKFDLILYLYSPWVLDMILNTLERNKWMRCGVN